MMSMLNNLKPNSVLSVEALKLETAVFKTILSENIVLVNKALQNSFIIPAFDVFTDHITEIYEKVKLTLFL
jgi:hypothetical protein